MSDLRCSVCGHIGGVDAEHERMVKLTAMRIICKKDVPEDAPDGFGCIVICTDCRKLMPFDIAGYIRNVDDMPIDASVYDNILFWLITIFVGETWNAPKPPSYQNVCDILNASRVYTQAGGPWTYPNLRQKCQRLGIDIIALGTRANSMGEIPDAVQPLLERVSSTLLSHPKFGPEYVNPEWGGLPTDLPGQDTEDVSEETTEI